MSLAERIRMNAYALRYLSVNHRSAIPNLNTYADVTKQNAKLQQRDEDLD